MELQNLKNQWSQVRIGLLATLDKFSEPDLAFQPFPGSWDVGALLRHIAYEELVEVQHGLLRQPPDFPGEYSPQDYPSLDAIRSLTSGLGVTACESCHVDGRMDGLAWDLGDPAIRKKVRTRLMVRASSSGGSRQGKTVISAFGANEATSIEVWSGCAGVSSGSTRIGVRQLRMKSRDTLYMKSGRAR